MYYPRNCEKKYYLKELSNNALLGYLYIENGRTEIFLY